MQHHVADGMSGIHCINTWSEMARGISLKVQPFIDRTLLKARSPPAPKFPHIEYQLPPRLRNAEEKTGHANGHANGQSNGHSNGQTNEHTNGHTNGGFKVNGNGFSNGYHEDQSQNGNGATNGVNGRQNANGATNGVNGHQNGNGATNGINGHQNGHGHQNGNGHVVPNGSLKSNGNGTHKKNVVVNGGSHEEELPMAVRVFRFSKEQLATLKQMAVDEQNEITYSSYEMLSGHIWKCATLSRRLNETQETKLFVATDGRSRLNPPLPKGYFGNVIFTSTPITTSGELVKNPLTFAAGKVSRSVLDQFSTK